MTGRCEFLEFLRAEIVAAFEQVNDPAQAAAVVIMEVQANYGGERAYIAVPENDRMQEGLRLLKNGESPERIAADLRVHVSTVHRWKSRIRKTTGTGFGQRDWVL